jgi:hypothetical protein
VWKVELDDQRLPVERPARTPAARYADSIAPRDSMHLMVRKNCSALLLRM